ncbi:alpha/beta hydrolase-fold protein [Tsukamurella ocularis]|uniref:alpha/beta hydrolase-fold protein n=1 Tax=Tsukamurella ocularis TaxID=1970234 RepID=UPI0021679D0C|nr:alpha/beta hydrolase-fold protein [Tsukamurella ocularis]
MRQIVVHGTGALSEATAVALQSLGSPLLTDDPDDPTRVRALFTWRPVPGDTAGGAYVWVNRLTDKSHVARGMMRRRAAGDLWFVELAVPRDVLATYRMLPLRAAGTEEIPAPRELIRRARIDPHNAAAVAGSPFGSVLAGPDAPRLDAWTAPAAAMSTALDRSIELSPAPLRYRLSVPSGARTMDLLITFDADAWFDRFRLPDVLAASGRRCAVLGIDSPADPAARLRFLGAHDDLFAAIADEVHPVVHQRIGDAGRVTIAGQSLGGLAALAFAARYPGLVDEVLAYSPSVWWRPGLMSRPVDVAARQNWIHDRIAACPAGAFSIRLASGAYEEKLTPGVADLVTTARCAGHDVEHTVYAGGHDEAQWAARLLAHLAGAP